MTLLSWALLYICLGMAWALYSGLHPEGGFDDYAEIIEAIILWPIELILTIWYWND